MVVSASQLVLATFSVLVHVHIVAHCQQKVTSCQYFRDWKHDFGGWWSTEISYEGNKTISYEGSLTTWFCPSGSHPQFGYSVCEKQHYHHSWSNHPRCQSLTTTTQRTWIRSPRDQYPSPTKKTNLFDVYPWMKPVGTIVCIIVPLLQPLIPFTIYLILTAKCCKTCQNKTSKLSAKNDEKEEKAIAAKYKTQLQEVESRMHDAESATVIAELRQIHDQLEKKINQVQARRRQRDRAKRKTIKPGRIISFYCYISFWLWMIYLITGFSAKLGQYDFSLELLNISAPIIAASLHIGIMVESWSCSERRYIKNLSSLTSATERIESIRNTQPSVTMNAVCYHYEQRTRTVYSTDANGNSQSRMETYWEKVVTAHIVQPFLFTHWYDSSETMLTDIRKAGITKIKMELTVHFRDRKTDRDFQAKFQQFQNQNRHHDVYGDFFVSNTVAGFEKRLTACTDVDKIPCWMSSVWFWLVTIFCLGWPYRILFNCCTGRTEYNVVKTIFIERPATAAIPADPNHTLENPEEDTVDNIRMKIQSTLDQLEAGLSANDDEMLIRCAATDQHMNVTLREADHSPQTAN